MPLTDHDQRPTTDDSVFGNVRVWRQYFTARGPQGRCPLDAELSLPARCYADLLREWASYGATDEAYQERQTVLERILGLPLRLQALEPGVAETGADVASCYEQPTEPTSPPPVGTLLVVQADGNGVPRVQPPLPPSPLRLGKGAKHPKKQEAGVTSLYTLAPDPRTPQEGVAALLRDPDGRGPAARPGPVGQELRATLEGKAVAMARLAERAAPRDGPHLQARGALTDGAQALPPQWLARFPQPT